MFKNVWFSYIQDKKIRYENRAKKKVQEFFFITNVTVM